MTRNKKVRIALQHHEISSILYSKNFSQLFYLPSVWICCLQISRLDKRTEFTANLSSVSSILELWKFQLIFKFKLYKFHFKTCYVSPSNSEMWLKIYMCEKLKSNFDHHKSLNTYTAYLLSWFLTKISKFRRLKF